ncbi:dihydrodipicolinate synthase family protein [Halobium salinum]|uniref:Dihydrodipicolinate synthase family protein n=1 Tax=Halobium salinum TaxID=1364940 RepID=A0ABD5PJ76_9EURY|nr:dihydrodipicolinate synthase family protein [Halobium salinum]
MSGTDAEPDSNDDPVRTWCPLVTPFDDDEAVDHEALATLVDHVREGGVEGLVPCGTTGEFASLDAAEYRAVLETTVDAAGDAPVMAGTAATSVAGTLDRVETAADVGADVGLIVLPYFHTANDPEGNAEFLRRVADDAALPLYLYNIPACTGQAIAPDVVESVADHDRIRGLKDSSGDFNYFVEALRRTPNDFDCYQGFDSYLVPGMLQGGTGGINALSNAIPEAFAAAAEAAAAGDVEAARRIGSEGIAPLFQQCVAHGFAPATKAALAERGVLDGTTVRPPLVELGNDTRAEIGDAVDTALDVVDSADLD